MNQSTNFLGQHIFSQILKLSSKHHLSRVFASSKANRYYKQLKVWEHFVTMMYAVLTNSTSLREVLMGLELAGGKLNHLGMDYAPPRSTLSDGNKNRPAVVFKSIYHYLYGQYKRNLSDSTLPRELLANLYLLDATVFSLFKAILKTSGRSSADGKKKGGIKKNTVIHAESLMPVLLQFGAAADNDQKIYATLQLPRGSYIVFDKGYNNYRQYARFDEQGIFFITRQKDNAVYTSVEEFDLSEQTPESILKDERIEMTYKDEQGRECKLQLRRIVYWIDKDGQLYEFITNNFELEAFIITQIYKYRWKIELFFKKLKQNFPLQYFLGDNQNAIEIQIWCALIALLLLSAIHSMNKSKMAFSNFVHIVRLYLLNYISIAEIIKAYNRKRTRCPKVDSTLFSSA
jgi:hypothetical protein